MVTRRDFLQTSGAGFGAVAAQSLLAGPVASEIAPKAKSVIFLFMYGGPSQVDTFDPKPALDEWHGRNIPVFQRKDAFFKETRPTAFRSPYAFARYGESGIPISDRFPHLSRHADELCVIRSMHAESNNHAPAIFQMNTGYLQSGHPSMGAWVSYGLGSESENLPAYVVLMDYQGAPVNGALNWSNGYMPAAYQGVPFRPTGQPIANLKLPDGVSPEQQQARLRLLTRFNREYALADPAESRLDARLAAYELAYRMQMHAPEVTDLASEPLSIRALYGMEQKTTAHFGRNCLLARRLVERGVRFVQVYSGGDKGPTAWDAHKDLKGNHDRQCMQTDQPIAALLKDLRQRGLLEETLVVWGGEFGRLPTHQGKQGRDHNPFGFTMWMAGAGVKGGTIHGATDAFGYRAVEDKVSVPDLHATMLHLLGVNHEALTYRFNGRDFRLTDVSGRVLTELLG